MLWSCFGEPPLPLPILVSPCVSFKRGCWTLRTKDEAVELPEIMECNSSDVQMSHCAKGSDTTMETKIKTLDSQTYNLYVHKCVSGPDPMKTRKIMLLLLLSIEKQ